MTPAQCRAARALLDWSQFDLAKAASVGNATIRNFEAGRSMPQVGTMYQLECALEEAGVVFLRAGEDAAGGPGVRLREMDRS